MSKTLFLYIKYFVVLGIIVLLAVTVIALVGVVHYRSPQSIIVPQERPSTVISLMESSAANTPISSSPKEELFFPQNTVDTANWQTYKNDQHEFELKYPENWDAIWKDGWFTTAPERGQIGSLYLFPKSRMDPNDDGGVYISVYSVPIAERELDYEQRGWLTKSEFTVNNAQGIVSDRKENGQWADNNQYIIGTNSYTFAFTDVGYTSIFEKVLSSFRYTR